MMGYKKLKDRKIINDKFGLKKYAENLSVNEARLIFKHRASMSQHVKYNFKASKVYIAEGWKCVECLNLDTKDHLETCNGYGSIRENLDLENGKDLGLYMHKIFLKRSEKKIEISKLD